MPEIERKTIIIDESVFDKIRVRSQRRFDMEGPSDPNQVGIGRIEPIEDGEPTIAFALWIAKRNGAVMLRRAMTGILFPPGFRNIENFVEQQDSDWLSPNNYLR